jgi:hypothetical protein
MKIEFFSNGTGEFHWGWIVLWGIIWLAVLWRILTRDDFDTLSRILWVIVVIFVPFFGVLLYLHAAPASVRKPIEEKSKTGRSDVAGTPWAKDSGFTQEKTEY